LRHISARVCAAVACATLAVSVAACGTSDPDPAAPVSGPELYAALPPAPVAQPLPEPATTTVAPPTTTVVPSTPKPRPKPEPAPPPELPWRQVAGDEFNGDALDLSTWGPYDSVGGFGNGLRRPEAISVSDGTLKITARGEVSGGMGHDFGQLHGRWEFRARTEPGRGLGSAVLLWPDSEQWPEDGEVDIMEVPGENRELAHFVLHWGEDNNIHGGSVPGNFANWHTFAVEWLPDRITWFVDGVKQYENTDPEAIPTTPMHLTVQLDMGPKTDWLPEPDETTPEEVSLEVDWVRVYAL
jgi:beta-glucanase (GH16 family)